MGGMRFVVVVGGETQAGHGDGCLGAEWQWRGIARGGYEAGVLHLSWVQVVKR